MIDSTRVARGFKPAVLSRRASSAPSAVDGASAPPSALPWSEFDRLGMLATHPKEYPSPVPDGREPVPPDAIGNKLDSTTSGQLLASMRRISGNGHRWIHGPASITPTEAFDLVARSSSSFKVYDLRVGSPRESAQFTVLTLDDIRRLDVVYGAGLEAAAPLEKAARLSIEDLVKNGWRFTDTRMHPPVPLSGKNLFKMLVVPVHGGDQPCATDPSGEREIYIESLEHAVAINYFYGSKIDRGLPDLARAQAARQLLDMGMAFQNCYREENTDLTFATAEHANIFVGYPKKVSLPFDDAAGRDVETFKRRLALADHVCTQISARIGPAVDVQWFVGDSIDKVLRDDPRFSLEDRAEALITLACAELQRQPAQPLARVVEASRRRFERIDAFTRTPEELKACSDALGAMIAAARSDMDPDQVVDDTVIKMMNGLERYSPAPKTGGVIQSSDDNVVIGGVKIPRRRT